MVEHKVCKGCHWNKYPYCHGTIMMNGNYMNIENQKPGFHCGKKDEAELTDFSIYIKSESESKIEELEARILSLELK